MLDTTKTTLNTIGGDLFNPPIEHWSTAEIAERVKQVMLLQSAEASLIRTRAASWSFTIIVCLFTLGALATGLGILVRVFLLDWVLAGCR